MTYTETMMRAKTVFITGGTSGIGRETAISITRFSVRPLGGSAAGGDLIMLK